jgi:hypothetical protein
MLKAIILAILGALFLAGGTTFPHPKVERYIKRHPRLRALALFMTGVAALYFIAGLFVDVEDKFIWLYQRVTIGPYLNREYSLSECDKRLDIRCIRYGGTYGDAGATLKIRNCGNLRLLPSSDPSLNWVSLWITNIYSYAPGGGGPGGGLINDVLKVGGWGDWYFSLVKFGLPTKNTEMNFAGVLLYVHDDEQETIPLFVDRIIEPWKWDLTQHIWWKDRPGGFPIVTEALPPPEKTHWYVVEITRLYNQWNSGAIGNFGFQIRPASNYGSIVQFTNNLASDKSRAPHLLLCPKT